MEEREDQIEGYIPRGGQVPIDELPRYEDEGLFSGQEDNENEINSQLAEVDGEELKKNINEFENPVRTHIPAIQDATVHFTRPEHQQRLQVLHERINTEAAAYQKFSTDLHKYNR